MEDEHTLEGKRRAIIIGINEYKEHNIPKLGGAENDARELYQRLKNPNIGNFDVSDEHFLLGENATSKRIRNAISDIFWEYDPCDVALFYFSGHAFVDGYGDGYIAPYDISINKPLVCGINMQELKHISSRSANACVIIILDSSYSGVIAKGETLR